MNIEQLTEVYHRDGFVVVPGLMSADVVSSIRNELDRYIVETLPGLPPEDYVLEAEGGPVRNLWRLERHSPFFAQLGENSRMAALVSALVNGDPVLMAIESFNKPARVGSIVPPHQDNAYFCLTPPDALTVWIAIDTVTKENGPVYYLRGSHKDGTLPHAASNIPGNSMGLRDTVMIHKAHAGLLEPGDAILHHCNTIHYSNPNRSDAPRRAMLMVFRGAHCAPDSALQERYHLARQG
jgi:ectoine hydroxylase-related dioxygenase (phytanoyl-CoA dioxygenase family)